MSTRRALLGASGLLLAGAGDAPAQGTAPYAPPGRRTRGLTLLVGAGSGSVTDLWVRGFAPFLERHLKQVQIQVVNRVGEGGLAVFRDLADAPADGSVLACVVMPSLVARAVERGAAGLLDRISLLGAVTEEPVVLLAPPGTEVETLQASAEGRPIGLPPPTSAAAIVAAELADALPIEQLHFPSAAAARQAAMAGNVVAALVTVPEAMQAVREGKLAMLGVASAARHPQFPEVPTFAEIRLPAEGAARRGLAAPSRIAPEAAARVTRALAAAAADPEFLAQAEARGILPRFRDGAAWNGLVGQDLAELRARWATSPWPVSGG